MKNAVINSCLCHRAGKIIDDNMRLRGVDLQEILTIVTAIGEIKLELPEGVDAITSEYTLKAPSGKIRITIGSCNRYGELHCDIIGKVRWAKVHFEDDESKSEKIYLDDFIQVLTSRLQTA